ncbi:MAG TPA: hypothetical protein ENK59_03455 [Thioploca sp.]|nr:hypothetical protein [Thioploca sp.]
MKKWLYISSLIFFISTDSYAFPQLVAGGVATWTNSGIMTSGLYAGIITSPIVLVGSGIAGFGAAKLMNDYWYNDCENQLVCDIASLNTYAGATVGIIITAILTSYATVTSSIVIGALITVPIFTAAVAGGISYWWFTDS